MDDQIANQSPWIDLIFKVEHSLNWIDAIAFAFGALAVLLILILIMRRFSQRHALHVEKIIVSYEEDVLRTKEKHIKEIYKAEKHVQAFKIKLQGIEKEYDKKIQHIGEKHEKDVALIKKAHMKRARDIEQDLGRASSTAQLSVFELKQKISRLRQGQVSEVEAFQKEIKRLKKEIEAMHEGHAKEIESAELEILDLRKQLNLLIYKV